MRRSHLLFIVAALAQLAVPAWMIVQRERVLHDGEVFKFRTAPIDPRDPFRGEYVRLDFAAEQGAWPDPMPGQGERNGYEEIEGFAVLGTDSGGFAVIGPLLPEPPREGPYLPVSWLSYGEARISRVRLPFDRFYLEEGDGARTERMLAPQWDEGVRQEPMPAYALVRILNGEAVIEDLVVGERSIHEWLKDPPSDAVTRRPTVIAVPDSPATIHDTLWE